MKTHLPLVWRCCDAPHLTSPQALLARLASQWQLLLLLRSNSRLTGGIAWFARPLKIPGLNSFAPSHLYQFLLSCLLYLTSVCVWLASLYYQMYPMPLAIFYCWVLRSLSISVARLADDYTRTLKLLFSISLTQRGKNSYRIFLLRLLPSSSFLHLFLSLSLIKAFRILLWFLRLPLLFSSFSIEEGHIQRVQLLLTHPCLSHSTSKSKSP